MLIGQHLPFNYILMEEHLILIGLQSNNCVMFLYFVPILSSSPESITITCLIKTTDDISHRSLYFNHAAYALLRYLFYITMETDL
jgi:hypothetical protein